jgi:hypothetical protein
MTMRKRLKALETGTTTDGTDTLLVALGRLLGIVDAVLTPPRFGGPRGAYAAAVDAIRTYHTAGVRFTSGTGRGASHVADHRVRRSLETRGWVTLHESRVKLTALGDRTARLAVGTAIDHWAYQLILDRLNQTDGWDDPRPGGWRSEFDLFGRAGDMGDLDAMLPLLSGGHIESTSSTLGVAYFRPTGKAWTEIDTDTAYSEAASQAHTSSYIEAITARKSKRYEGSECFCPISATR